MEDAKNLRPDVRGRADPAYSAVVEAFADVLREPERSGAALSIWRDGHEVVDVWAGVADGRTGRPWDTGTRSNIFSASKGLSSLVIGRLVDRGLDLDLPLAELWPEFGVHGKGAITIGDALAHRAGVSAPDADLTLADVRDRDGWARRVAAQRPWWEPGSGHAYHAVTWGVIADEIVRRFSGLDLRALFADEIAGPLDADVTLSPDRRTADESAWLVTSSLWASADLGDGPVARALTLGSTMPVTLVAGEAGFNDPDIRTLGLAAAGGLGTASGLARIWSAAIVPTRGIRVISDHAIAALCRPRSAGPWVFEGVPGPYQTWGAGVELSSPAAPMLSPSSFGHGGAGGQAAFADPPSGIAVGYLRNRLDFEDPMPPILEAIRRV